MGSTYQKESSAFDNFGNIFWDRNPFEKENGISIAGEKKYTRRAIFLILFIAENCFSRDTTAESRGLSGATVSSRIHG